MSRQYGITTYGTNQYNTYVNTQTIGPFSTNQYPLAMLPHNSGVLVGVHPNPPKFYPSDNTDTVSNARYEYLRTVGPLNTPLAHSNKYIAPASSSLFTSARKRVAIGKSSLKQDKPAAYPLSYKNYNVNDSKTALQRARSSGCVAPKKKGAIQNYSLRNGQIYALGAIVRQNY